MSSRPAPSAAAAPAGSLAHLLLIGLLPVTDFLQNGVVAFNAAPIMGDIGASPQEYALVATLYAVVAISAIFHQRWLIEQLGWRVFIGGSCALFAAGSLGCALSDTLAGFASARMLMATGAAAFFTAGRVLVNHIPPSPRRFAGIRFFASGVAWGAVLGPLLASLAYTHGSWRDAFLALLLPAGLMGLLAMRVLPGERPPARAQAHPVALAVLVGGSFLFLHALQRSNFAFFAEPAMLGGLLVLSLPLLALFGWVTLRREAPVIELRALAQPRVIGGMVVFTICYVVLGANNTVMPVLLRGFGLPLERIDLALALGGLGGVAYLAVALRFLPKHPGPSRYYFTAFGALGLCAWQLSMLSESAHPLRDVVPALLGQGVFVIASLSTTSIQTFMSLTQDEVAFSHGNQLKNMLAQLGTAAGLTIATLWLQSRGAFHQTRLVESLYAGSPALNATLAQLTAHFAATVDAVQAPRMALGQVAATLAQEAQLLATIDYFAALAVFALMCVGLVLVERGWRAIMTRSMP